MGRLNTALDNLSAAGPRVLRGVPQNTVNAPVCGPETGFEESGARAVFSGTISPLSGLHRQWWRAVHQRGGFELHQLRRTLQPKEKALKSRFSGLCLEDTSTRLVNHEADTGGHPTPGLPGFVRSSISAAVRRAGQDSGGVGRFALEQGPGPPGV
jgi:hypothetical protein